MKLYEIPRNIKNETNFSFWLSLINEAQNLTYIGKNSNVLDFGCGTGGFLRLFDHLFPERKLTGVEINNELITNNIKSSKNISYLSYENIRILQDESFDIAFSQEVIYTMPDLLLHAKEVFQILRKGSYYIASIGCHIENPTWNYRRNKIRNSEHYYAYDYTLDEIARSFYDCGFRVSVKRLPIRSPLKVSFENDREFRTINELLTSSYDYKIMFFFLKPKYQV